MAARRPSPKRRGSVMASLQMPPDGNSCMSLAGNYKDADAQGNV